MTYRIEINADSLTELAGKVLALAAQLNSQSVDPVMPEVREASKPKKAKAEKVEDGAALTATSHPVNADVVVPEDVSPEALVTVEIDVPASEPLDFDKDVAPAVLALVAAKGKPAVQDILSEYGVERASQVDEDLWPELVATLRAAV